MKLSTFYVTADAVFHHSYLLTVGVSCFTVHGPQYSTTTSSPHTSMALLLTVRMVSVGVCIRGFSLTQPIIQKSAYFGIHS
jgi:hypothetical protein